MTNDNEPFLRPLLRTDVEDVLAAFVSNPDMERQGDVTTLASDELYVSRLLEPASGHRAMAIVEQDRLVGLVAVTVDEANRSGWFWYWMHANSRGRGWMSRAAATVAHLALTEWKLERLELGHRVNNPASGAVAKAAGFILEGTERAKFLVDGRRIDVDTYSRLPSDPVPEFTPLPICGNEPIPK